MFETILALLLLVVLILAMLVWVPILLSAETLGRRYSSQRSGTVPELTEEEPSPELTGKVA
jgi:hypothetical protein